jgi:hypothetical protein
MVPAGVPSVRHNVFWPLCTTTKNTRFFTDVRPRIALLPPPTMLLTTTVPAGVPLLFHSSVGVLPEPRVKNSVPFTFWVSWNTGGSVG